MSQQEYGSFAPTSPVASWLLPNSGKDVENGATTTNGGKNPTSILLFGLSANPPTGHMGHAGIVSFLAEQNQWDEIWVMPVYKHMHPKNSLLIDFESRFQMCLLNFLPTTPSERRKHRQHQYQHNDKIGKPSRTLVKVVKLEKEVADYHVHIAREQGRGPETVKVGTIDVVLYAKERMPQTNFFLVLGTDTYSDIKKGKWKRGRELLELVSVVVVSRPGMPYTIHDSDIANAKVRLYDVPTLSDISSTAVRKTTDMRLLRHALSPRVLEYILKHRLYTIGKLEAGKRRTRRRRRVRWMLLTTLFVAAGFLFAYRKWGLRGMENGLRNAMHVAKGLVRVEKDISK